MMPDYDTCRASGFTGRVDETVKVARIQAVYSWVLEWVDTVEGRGHFGADLFYLLGAIAADEVCHFYPSRYKEVLEVIDAIYEEEHRMRWLEQYIDRKER